jgi:hypothetical protein
MGKAPILKKLKEQCSMNVWERSLCKNGVEIGLRNVSSNGRMYPASGLLKNKSAGSAGEA